MTTRALSEDVLRAPRVRQQVLVARGHPDPERVRHQLHDALSTHLNGSLADAFTTAGAPHDDSVWRIRMLTLNVTVNAQWDAPRLARAWATQFAHVVRRTMENGGDGVHVMHWVSRAAYLASFVRDVTDGTAQSRWWFETFSGLRLLARSSQIRTALVHDAPLGRSALVLMSAADVALVVTQLSSLDARCIVNAIAPALEANDVDAAATALLEVHRALDAWPTRADEERWVLSLIVEALRSQPRITTGALANVARAMARLSQVTAEQPERAAVVRRLLIQGNATGLRLVVGDGDAERLAPLARASGPIVNTITDSIAANVAPRESVAHQAENDAVQMPIGAPIVLAPFVAELPLEEATRDWPAIGGDEPPTRSASAPSLVRLFTLAAACGGERAARVLADSTTRRLAGVGDAVTAGQMRDWLDKLNSEHAARLEQAAGDWRIASGTISRETWLLADATNEDVTGTLSRFALLDCARGCWLALRDDEQLEDGLQALGHWPRLASAANGPRHLLVATERMARIARGLASSAIDVRLAADLPLDLRQDNAITATLARCDRLAGERDWLRLPASLAVPRPIEFAFAVLAQGILRDFAWRLPGFARASLPHLWVNFLAVDAQLEQEPKRLVARIGRPPLAMVIGMTGIMRRTYRLPWLGTMQIALFPSDSA